MAKRFTDSEKWDDSWFSELSNNEKVVWLYLLDKCNHAGIVQVNLRTLNFYCNTSYNDYLTISELLSNRLVMINESYAFIPKFLKFQYDKGIGSSKPMIVSVRKELERFGLMNKVSELLGNSFIMINEPLVNSCQTIKDKDKDKDKGKDKETSLKKECELFPIWWDKYGKKRGGKVVKIRWNNLSKANKQKCLDVVDDYVKSTPDASFRKMPQTYLNQESWNDDLGLGEKSARLPSVPLLKMEY